MLTEVSAHIVLGVRYYNMLIIMVELH